MMRLVSVCALAVVLAAFTGGIGTAAPAGKAAAKSNAAQLFDELKQLEGDWDATWEGRTFHAEKQPLVDQIRVVSNGTVVKETVATGAKDEMMTLYHLDGSSLIIQHFCNLGNQPTFRLSPAKTAALKSTAAGAQGTVLSFETVRVSNLPAATTAAKAKGKGKGGGTKAGGAWMQLDWIKIIDHDNAQVQWTLIPVDNPSGKTQRVISLKRRP